MSSHNPDRAEPPCGFPDRNADDHRGYGTIYSGCGDLDDGHRKPYRCRAHKVKKALADTYCQLCSRTRRYDLRARSSGSGADGSAHRQYGAHRYRRYRRRILSDDLYAPNLPWNQAPLASSCSLRPCFRPCGTCRPQLSLHRDR